MPSPAQEMEAEFAARVAAAQTRAVTAPRELQELDARLERLRTRLAAGDPDMTTDELQGLIDRVYAKRKELQAAQPATRQQAKILAMLPRAAEAYLQQIDLGLSGDPRAILKSKVILRDLVGPIRLEPATDGSLWANYKFNAAALVKGATGTYGRGDRI